MATFPKIICRVRAIYPFSSKEPASLSFDKDDYIDVLAQLDSGWWDGWCGGSRGWFPSNYVEIVEENPEGPMPPSPAPTNKTHSSPMVDPKRGDLRQHSRRQRSNSTTQHRLSLKTLSNISSNMSTPVPRRAPPAATTPPVTSPIISNGSKFGWTAASNRTSNSTVSDGSVYNLPEGWSAQLAEDGTTRYYYNHRTGKMQYDHPGFGFSDGEYDSEYEASMDDTSYYSDEDYEDERYQHSRLATMRRMSNRLSLDSLPANVDTPATAFSDDFKQPPPLQESAAMSHWVQRVTPQGREYYCNLVTQETTWDYGEIDQATGRLKHSQQDSDSDTDEPIGRTTTSHTHQSSNHAAELINPSNNGDSTCSSPTTPIRDEPLTWHKLASTTAMAIHHLNMAAQRGERDAFVEDASSVVVSIRMMLYASGMLDKDSNHMQDRMLRDPHRAVMAALSKLVLSVKTASEGSHKTIQPELLHRVQRDAGDVLAAVRSFVTVCQERRVKVEQVKPQLMFDTDTSTISNESTTLVTSNTAVEFDPEATRIATGLGQKSKYPLNQDLLVSLQTHANQVYGSTNALCSKAAELNTNEDGKSLSTVILLFRSLSMQIGQYLSILEDIDLVNIDDSKIPSLGDYLVNKQKLYNAVGVLFGVVQSLSSNRIDASQCVQDINEAVQSVENTIKLILTNVDEMIKQRRNWYRQLNPGDDDEMPMSPVSARFDDSDSDDGELCKAPTDKARKLMLYQPPVLPRSATENGGGGCLGYDYPPEEIVYGQDGNIKGGTLRALVERLTLHDSLDTSFIATFLLTYRSFCTTEEFLSLLEQRYNIRPTEELTPWELEEWSERKQKLVRLRVFNVMKIWLENYYNDEDQFILNRLEFFTNTVIRDTSPFSADQLNRLIRMRKDQDANSGLKKLVPNALPGPMPILPKDITRLALMEIDPTELARQLTVMDFKLYSSIRPIECLNKAWSQDDEMAASSVKQSIDYCNRLTCWVSDSILSNDEAKKRVVVIKYWAQVASKCRNMNNYNTCMAIISAFDTSSIGRLKKTWELVGNRTSQTLANIRRLMGANRNFQEYRDLIHSINPPCIPFLGIYLQDLTFIEDGNADYIQKSAGLINFAKRAKTAEVIREINQFQNAPYIFTHIPELQTFIKTNLEGSRDVDMLYQRSLQIEPREVVTYN
ncbi:ras GEF [Lichtheimia hyalospora FSU 10163]|nr:ras GEF [Lichtheimia hyalospora FSU 10163]